MNISPTIYLEEYFKNFQQGVKLEAIVEEMLELYEDIRQEKSWDYEKILCYERIKDKIVFKLINTAKNRKFLDTVPHFPFLDLSAVFYVLLEVTDEGTAAMTHKQKSYGAMGHTGGCAVGGCGQKFQEAPASRVPNDELCIERGVKEKYRVQNRRKWESPVWKC